MKGPFIVGMSFASEDIGWLLYNRSKFNIVASMLADIPKKGDVNYRMEREKMKELGEEAGRKWVPWQAA